MNNSEILAILRFLEETRKPGLTALGLEARDPTWMMTIALLRRYYAKQRITITSLAGASGAAHATAIRHIDKMIEAGLITRERSRQEPKLVYIEPTETLLSNFREYCRLYKNRIGATFGLDQHASASFVFGGAHLAARIIPAPSALAPPLGLDGPLRLLLADEPTFHVLKQMRPEISAFLNMPIEIDQLEYEELNKRVIDNGRALVSAYDLIAVDAPWLGRIARDGLLSPLEEDIRRSRLNPFDFYSAAWEAAHCAGRHWGLMLAATVELFLYRKDLFAAKGLDVPRSAGDVIDAARRIHDPQNGLYGVSWNAAAGQPLGQTFIQVMAAFGSPPVSLRQYGAGYDLDTPLNQLRPTLDNDAGERTLEYLIELSELSPPHIGMMDWDARTAAFRSGLTAMSYDWSSRTRDIESDPSSPARGNTGYLPHVSLSGEPGVCPMGGWLLGIPANITQERRRGVWRALQWMAMPEMTKCLVQNGSPARFLHSLSGDPEVPQVSPAADTVDALQRRGLLQVWPRPPIPFITSLMRIVGREVHEVIWGGASSKGALSRIENRLNPMFDSLVSRERSK